MLCGGSAGARVGRGCFARALAAFPAELGGRVFGDHLQHLEAGAGLHGECGRMRGLHGGHDDHGVVEGLLRVRARVCVFDDHWQYLAVRACACQPACTSTVEGLLPRIILMINLPQKKQVYQ